MQRGRTGETTREVRARVERARAIQADRAKRSEVSATTNAALPPRDLDRVATLCEGGSRLLGAAVSRLALSARAYGKVLRVSRTLADLEGCAAIAPHHIAEAIGYRTLDRSAPLPAISAA
jgi:magnesium chelatase family protein